MLDRLTGMAVFVKAADLGSFTAAAAALDLSPQMVGKHVALLEQRLGVELIRRTTRRQSLTEVGRAFHERCRHILAEAEAAERIASEIGETPRGLLRVNAPLTFGALCLAPLIGQFLAEHRQVTIELSLADRYVDLVEEGFDAVIRLGDLPDSTLIARALAPHRLVACASPAYLERHGTPMVPDDLASHECLCFVYTTGLTLQDWNFTQDGRTRSVRVRGPFRCNDARALLDAALAGRGIVLLAERVIRDEIAAGRLVRVLADHEGWTRAMHVLVSPGRRHTAALRLFLDRIAEAFG